MSIKQFFMILCGFCAIGTMTHSAQASEALLYNQKLSKSSAFLISKFLDAPLTNFDIAQIDLNDDGLREFIVKPASCAAESKPCHFTVLAESDNSIIPIGEITAKEIAVDTQTISGVRNIHAFDNPLNDFSYSLYIWEATRSQYMMKSER